MRRMTTRSSAIEEASDAGFHLSLIDQSLGYAYEKRALQHQAALDLALELSRIGEQLRGAAQSTSRTALRR